MGYVNMVKKTLISETTNKLGEYERAELEGYINRCTKCGSLNIIIEDEFHRCWGDTAYSSTCYLCCNCGHKWE